MVVHQYWQWPRHIGHKDTHFERPALAFDRLLDDLLDLLRLGLQAGECLDRATRFFNAHLFERLESLCLHCLQQALCMGIDWHLQYLLLLVGIVN